MVKDFVNKYLILYLHSLSGCSVARLSRLLWEQEAAGSNPATPTKVFSIILKGLFLLRLFIFIKKPSFKLGMIFYFVGFFIKTALSTNRFISIF